MAQAVIDKTFFLEQLREIASGMTKGGEEGIAGLIKLRNLLEESEFGYRTLDFSDSLPERTFTLLWMLHKLVIETILYNIEDGNIIVPESKVKPLLERISIHLAWFIREFLNENPEATRGYIDALTTCYELLRLYEKAATGGRTS